MVYQNVQAKYFILDAIPLRFYLTAMLLVTFFAITAYSQTVNQKDEHTIVVEGEQVFLSFGKDVIVPKQAQGVLVIGGDAIIEGSVEEDVGALGGNVIQKQDAFIGGDVIVFGGTYKHERLEPLRSEGKTSVIIGGFEEELRDLARNPSQILSPQLTWEFLFYRLLAVLFWFVVSFVVTTIAPGAISRSVERFHLSISKIAGVGLFGFTVFLLIVFGGLKFLPNYLSVVIVLMASVLLILAYVFGRVTLQVSAGKWLQKRFFANKIKSEAVALLIGSAVWTALLSLPYIWTFALFFLFIVSLGIILTARSKTSWEKV